MDVLTPYLDRTWSPAYIEAGFGQSLAVPNTLAGRLESLRCLDKFLTANPQYCNAQLKITGSLAKDHYDLFSAGIKSVTRCRFDTRKKKARAAAREVLLRRLRGLVNELDQLLPADDSRWTAFGFNAPGESQAPEAVEELEVEGGGAGQLFVDWGDSTRADRYRVEILVVGQNQDFRRATTVQDSSADLEDLPPGARVKLRIVAGNDAGESVPSQVVEATVPLAA